MLLHGMSCQLYCELVHLFFLMHRCWYLYDSLLLQVRLTRGGFPNVLSIKGRLSARGLGTKSSRKDRKSSKHKCVNSVTLALNCFLERAGTWASKSILNRLPVIPSVFAHSPPIPVSVSTWSLKYFTLASPLMVYMVAFYFVLYFLRCQLRFALSKFSAWATNHLSMCFLGGKVLLVLYFS